MKYIHCVGLLLVLIMAASCGQTTGVQNQKAQATPVKIVLNGQPVALTQTPLIKQDTVYVTIDDLKAISGIQIDYDPVSGNIVAQRNQTTFNMQIGKPYKEGDIKGPAPFLQGDKVYLPLCDTLSRLDYGAKIEKSADGKPVVMLEKWGYDLADLWTPFSSAELKAAEQALAKGVSINDPQADWALISEGRQPDGRTDNGYPYPLPFTDVRNVTFGADSQYFYIKITLDDVIPGKMVYYQNPQQNKKDYIASLCTNLGLHHFFNRNTGKDDAGLMQLGISYIEGGQNGAENPRLFEPPAVAVSNFATSTGLQENGEDTYVTANAQGRVGGGSDKNYAIGAFPLSNYGLQLGDEIECDVSMESGSKLFHHECVDVILDCGYKMGASILYRLGDSTYQNLGPAKNLLPLNGTLGVK